jgi:transposase
MLPLIRDIIKQAAYNLDLPKTSDKEPKRPRHNPVDEAKVILMAQYFSLSNRAAQGYMLLFNKEKLRLTSLFSHKTIERAYSDIEVRQILEEVFELTNRPVADLEYEFGPDGTGLTTSGKQNYENDGQTVKHVKGMGGLL